MCSNFSGIKITRAKKIITKFFIKVLEFSKNPKTFLNNGTKHNKNYMKGLTSKNENKNIKGGGSSKSYTFNNVFCNIVFH